MYHQKLTDSQNTDMHAPAHLNSGKWKKSEHELFLTGLEIYDKDWKKIAQLVGTRSDSQVRSHAQKYNNKLANDSEKIGAQPLQVRGQNDIAITRSKNRQHSEKGSSQDSKPKKSKNKKIKKDQERPNKKYSSSESSNGEAYEMDEQRPTSYSFYVPMPIRNCQHSETQLSDFSDKSFYLVEISGQQLFRSAQSSFMLYSMLESDREELVGELQTRERWENEEI